MASCEAPARRLSRTAWANLAEERPMAELAAAPAGPEASEAVTGILLRQVAELEEALRGTVRAQAKRAGSDGKRP